MIKKNILVFKSLFLPLSEINIFKELTNLKNFNIFLCYLNYQNLDIFGKNNFEIFYNKKFDLLINFILNSRDKNLNLITYKKLKIQYYLELIKIIKKNNIKTIYTQNLIDMYFLIGIKKFLKNMSFISAGRGKDVYFFLPTLGDKISFLNQIDKILVRDKPMKSFIENQGINKKNIEVVRSFCDLNIYKFKLKNYKKLKLLIGGRLSDEKGVLELIDLIYLLFKNKIISNIGFICGELENKNEYSRLIFKKIEKLGISKNIKFYKFLEHNEYIKILNKYNFYINYSKIYNNGNNEGIPNMLIENILVGNLCFSTLTGGIGELGLEKYGLNLTGNQKKDFKIITNFLKKNNVETISNIVINLNKKAKEMFGEKNSIQKLDKIL